MRKRVFGRQLSRERGSRRALFRSMTRALVFSGKIKTTKAKAKALVPFVEKLIILGMKGSVNSRRSVLSDLGNDIGTLNEMYKKVIPAHEGTRGGFVKITALPERTGDNARMVILELTKRVVDKKEKKGKDSKQQVKVTKKELGSRLKSKK